MGKIDYINSLPKKPIGAAAVFFNKNNEMLIVKPNYLEDWLVPGGTIDALESPRHGCIREIKEEIGLDIQDLIFLGVQHDKNISDEGIPYDSLQFTFWGGILSDEQIANIVLQKEELDELRFCKIDEALSLLRHHLSHRVKMALDAMPNNSPIYSEL